MGVLQQADAARKAEFEKWLPVTKSTDSGDAENFLESGAGKTLLKR